MLLIWVALCFQYYLHTQFKTILNTTRSIELKDTTPVNKRHPFEVCRDRLYTTHPEVITQSEWRQCMIEEANG